MNIIYSQTIFLWQLDNKETYLEVNVVSLIISNWFFHVACLHLNSHLFYLLRVNLSKVNHVININRFHLFWFCDSISLTVNNRPLPKAINRNSQKFQSKIILSLSHGLQTCAYDSWSVKASLHQIARSMTRKNTREIRQHADREKYTRSRIPELA